MTDPHPMIEEIDPEVLTPVADEMDQMVQRMVQHAVNGILEERGLHWLDDAWFAAVTGVFCGLTRVVGVMPPESQAAFWRAVMEQADGIKAMQQRIFQDRVNGTLVRRNAPDA